MQFIPSPGRPLFIAAVPQASVEPERDGEPFAPRARLTATREFSDLSIRRSQWRTCLVSEARPRRIELSPRRASRLAPMQLVPRSADP